jgi:DtxR family Mn-dependent transcriptional regulator
VISDDVEELIVVKLGNPTTCPHGNPIPGAQPPDVELVPLSETLPGATIRLERVSEQLELNYDALVYLDSHGFIPGAEGTVQTVAPDQTRLVDLAGHTIAVGTALAEQLYVSLR